VEHSLLLKNALEQGWKLTIQCNLIEFLFLKIYLPIYQKIVTNNKLMNAFFMMKETCIIIDVRFNTVDPPIAQLRLGGYHRLDEIKEGDDVFFDCIIRATPWITNVFWRHNVLMFYIIIFGMAANWYIDPLYTGEENLSKFCPRCYISKSNAHHLENRTPLEWAVNLRCKYVQQ